jgi:hypothetical protein
MAIFEVCQGAKAVPLDLKEPVRMGKGPWRTANCHGLKIRQHLSNINERDGDFSSIEDSLRSAASLTFTELSI